MNQETAETENRAWAEAHPWLAQKPAQEEDDSLGEVIRYTLDEMRIA